MDRGDKHDPLGIASTIYKLTLDIFKISTKFKVPDPLVAILHCVSIKYFLVKLLLIIYFPKTFHFMNFKNVTE